MIEACKAQSAHLAHITAHLPLHLPAVPPQAAAAPQSSSAGALSEAGPSSVRARGKENAGTFSQATCLDTEGGGEKKKRPPPPRR